MLTYYVTVCTNVTQPNIYRVYSATVNPLPIWYGRVMSVYTFPRNYNTALP